jgi:exosome complex component RRP45
MAAPVSNNERDFIVRALRKGLRVDGRGASKTRNIKITFGRKAGSVEVQIGRTRVMAATTADVVKPYPDRPAEGFLQLYADFSPMASPEFEHNRPSSKAVQLTR